MTVFRRDPFALRKRRARRAAELAGQIVESIDPKDLQNAVGQLLVLYNDLLGDLEAAETKVKDLTRDLAAAQMWKTKHRARTGAE